MLLKNAQLLRTQCVVGYHSRLLDYWEKCMHGAYAEVN